MASNLLKFFLKWAGIFLIIYGLIILIFSWSDLSIFLKVIRIIIVGIGFSMVIFGFTIN